MNKKILKDEDIFNLDYKEIEYYINSKTKLSLEQLLLLWNKSLKMKFDEESISKIKSKVENELNKINNFYEIKRIQKKMNDLLLDTTYINKLKKNLLLKDLQNPNSNINKVFNSVITNSQKKDE